jgi:hypothetical protein
MPPTRVLVVRNELQEVAVWHRVDQHNLVGRLMLRLLRCRISIWPMTGSGRVSRAPTRVLAARNCTRDEGGPFGFGDQVLISVFRQAASNSRRSSSLVLCGASSGLRGMMRGFAHGS